MSAASLTASRRKRDVDMTVGAIVPHLIKFAIPLLIGNLFQTMYNMVDTWVVGNFVGDDAFSAVGSMGTVSNLMIGFFTGLAAGAGVVISQSFGAGNLGAVKHAVHTAAIMTVAMGVLFTLAGAFLIGPLMVMLKMPEELIPYAKDYLRIWFAGISGLMIYNMGAGILRAVGDSRRPFIFLVVSAVTNTVLDLVFVLVFDMGVKGVALATVIAQAFSAVLVVILLFTTSSSVKLELRAFRLDFGMLKRIVLIGLPNAVQLSVTAFSNVFVLGYINHFGKECMGGYTAYNKIDQVVLLPMQSLSIACTTFVGQNLGKGMLKRAEKGANVALGLALLSAFVLIVPIELFAGFFVEIFNKEPAIVEYGKLILRIMTPFYLFAGVSQIYCGALRGSGNSAAPMAIILGCYVAFRQLYLFVVTEFVSNTFIGVILAFPAGWVLAASFTFIYYKLVGLGRENKKKNLES